MDDGRPPGVYPAKGTNKAVFADDAAAAYEDKEYPEGAGRLMDPGSDERKIMDVEGNAQSRADYVYYGADWYEAEGWRDNYVGNIPHGIIII